MSFKIRYMNNSHQFDDIKENKQLHCTRFTKVHKGIAIMLTILLLFLTGCSGETRIEDQDNTRVVVSTIDCITPSGQTQAQEYASGNAQEIPADVEQSNIHSFTPNYGGIGWDKTSKQYQICQQWKEAGSVYKDKLAMIGDRYLVAVVSKIGSVGDYVDFELADGTILKTIIADQKSSGDSNSTEWGHLLGGKTAVLEFEVAADTTNNIGEGGFHTEFGQTVKSFVNLGSDGETAESTSSASASNSAASSSSLSSSSGASIEKDGYKIPESLDGTGTSKGEDQRGKGIFAMEQHMIDALADGQEHKTSSEWYTDNGAIPGSGPWGDATSDEEEYYICMRWEYINWTPDSRSFTSNGESTCGMAATGSVDSEQMSWTRKQRVAITNPSNGRTCVCAIIEAGPGPANRIGGLSPEAYNYLTNNCQDTGGGSLAELEVLGWCENENQPLGPTTDIDAANETNEECNNQTGEEVIADSGIEGALEWMKKGCDDDTVGYDQGTRTTVKDYDGSKLVNADCSSYVYYALLIGGGFDGIEQSCGGYAFTTDSMNSALEENGWEKHELTSVDDLQRGDILWRDGHTEFYFGENNSGGAHSSRGNTSPGDQAGNECSVGDPDSGISDFTHYFRYTGSGGRVSSDED